MGYNPNYKWINPTYPIYNWGYNPLTIRGMSHQVPGEHIHADDVLQLTWQELVRSNLQAPARQLRGHLLVPAMSDLEAQGDRPSKKIHRAPKKVGKCGPPKRAGTPIAGWLISWKIHGKNEGFGVPPWIGSPQMASRLMGGSAGRCLTSKGRMLSPGPDLDLDPGFYHRLS